MNTAAVLTISDSSFQGKREDLSGPAVTKLLVSAGFEVKHTAVVPDESIEIQKKLIECCGHVCLVVTVGGTGLALRDVTPEATLAVVERVVPGIPEKMRAEGVLKTPMAVLSRGVCGIRGQAMILNLPGSPKAAVDSLHAVINILPHALDLLSGKTEHK
ncbi:MAG: MogA/MoaB family molybdenum cofactor biosynthesis protein [Acidobacteriia bacterium]|nr:MogA/MoaB family molybdenum cofactor biosynthesis protein [Terriglobia bacterium]